MGFKKLWKAFRKGLSQNQINGFTLLGIGGTLVGLINNLQGIFQPLQPILLIEAVFLMVLGLNQIFKEEDKEK